MAIIQLNKTAYKEYLETAPKEYALSKNKMFCAKHREHFKKDCARLCAGGYAMSIDIAEAVTLPKCVIS